MQDNPLHIRTVQVLRYIAPLREGGSLPAIAEADDGFKYVLKFRGAGQGPKALIAEFIGGEMARALHLPIPEIVFAVLDEAFGRTEPDEEIQDLLKASRGLNLGIHFLSGAITYDPVSKPIDGLLASKIVWLDNIITNVDRTAKNTNMLLWHKELWLIDHGAALYFHHNWESKNATAEKTFPQIKDQVLLRMADQLEQANDFAKSLLTPATIEKIVYSLPDEWLQWTDVSETPDTIRESYIRYLTTRISHADFLTQNIIDARASLI